MWGDRGFGPSEKSQKYRVSLQYWSRSPVKSQSYQASIQCWASICPPKKRYFNGVSLAGQCWPIFSGIWILYSPINQKKRYQIWPPLTKLSGSWHGSLARTTTARTTIYTQKKNVSSSGTFVGFAYMIK